MSSPISQALGESLKTQYFQIGVGIVITTFAGGLGYYPIWFYYDEALAKEYYRACQWAAITVLLVTTPFLGQTMQLGVERAFGTVLGGFVGWLVNFLAINPYFISLSATVTTVAFLAIFWLLKLDYAGKIGAMTMLIVSMGGFVQGTSRQTLALAISRTSGILAGIVVSTVVSITVAPQPAATELMRLCKKSMLTAKDFHLMAWAAAPSAFCSSNVKPSVFDDDSDDSATGQTHSPLERAMTFRGFRKEVHRKKDKAYTSDATAERKFNAGGALSMSREVVGLGNQAKSCFGFSRHEKHFLFFGSSMYIPTWPIVSDTIPEEEYMAFRDAVSNLWRIIWSLNMSLFDGFEAKTQQRILKRIPPTLMPDIRETADDTLDLLHKAFPLLPVQPKDSTCMQNAIRSASRLDELVELLLDLSLWNRHQTHVKMHEMASRASGEDLSRLHRSSSPADSSANLQSQEVRPVVMGTPDKSARDLQRKDSLKHDSPQKLEDAVRRTLSSPKNRITGDNSDFSPPTTLFRRPDLALEVLPEVLSLSDMVKSLQEDVLFEDSPQGFIQEVRWMSFVYELKMLSDAVTDLAETVNAFVSRLPLSSRHQQHNKSKDGK